MKTSPESALGCNLDGSTLDGLSVKGVDSPPNCPIVRARDEWETLRDHRDRWVDDRDGATTLPLNWRESALNIHKLIALAGVIDALMEASQIAQARFVVRELRSALDATERTSRKT